MDEKNLKRKINDDSVVFIVRLVFVGLFTFILTAPLFFVLSLFAEIIIDKYYVFSWFSLKIYSIIYLLTYLYIYFFVTGDEPEKNS